MTHSPSIEDLLNALLVEASFAQDLTDDDKATIRTMVQAMTGDLQEELHTAFQSPNGGTLQNASTVEGLTAELDSFLSELGDMPLTQATVEPLNKQTDSALVEVLGSHVESAGGVVEVLSTRTVSQQALNALRCVELQLTALTIGVSDLRQALEQNLRPQSRRFWRRSITALLRRIQFRQHSNAAIVKPQHIALFALMICIPLGLKLGVPTLLHQAERARWFEQLRSQNSSFNTVESIQNGILLIKTPAGETLRVKLAGLDLDTQWQAQAEGIMAMLLQPAQTKVMLSHTQMTQNGVTTSIVSLPNGTSLQEILLSDGLAKLNLGDLNPLPEPLVLKLKQAETKAKLQHKNVWGDSHNASPH
ncbi:MAG: hypothetical protein KME10_03905 [Plectolyngbya sp. WJT66-NPBG17]|jgi:hypothetical protein|nr:hypothetical protein [Plectolyngbya sp. WJT66-NPBG17]MBW4528083.1 hypothetical protein [Phormidium tanganyikae FI6-MK23]